MQPSCVASLIQNKEECVFCRVITQNIRLLIKGREFDIKLYIWHIFSMPIPVAARSKAWVYGHCLAGIAGSNPAGDINVYLF